MRQSVRGLLCLGFVILSSSILVGRGRAAHGGRSADTIVVTTVAELEAALAPGNEGREILVRAGTYLLSSPLIVPEHASVVGEGDMLFDQDGLPAGIEPSTRTLLKASAALDGDILMPGDGATLRGLSIEDAPGRQGNLVRVSSDGPGAQVAVTILACEFINPNPASIHPRGPIGRSVAAISANPDLGGGDPPHEGSFIQVVMRQSITQSPANGSGVFAANFASRSHVSVVLSENVIGGGLDGAGGVSRPDAVSDAGVQVESHRNVYRSDGTFPAPNGWNIVGASDAPVPFAVSAPTSSNVFSVNSVDDRIEGFVTGINGYGARRNTVNGGAISGGRLELQLLGTRMLSRDTDFAWYGVRSFVGIGAGDGNTLHVVVRNVQGSGRRANQYVDNSVPPGPGAGTGNRVIIAGGLQAFVMTNQYIDNLPGAMFFRAGR